MNSNEINLSELDKVYMADIYQEALMWSTYVDCMDGETEEQAQNFESSTNLRDHCEKAVDEFLAACATLDADSRDYINEKKAGAGHYLALARNGHGAGFFDDDQDALQELAQGMGAVYLFLNNDNEVDVEC